MVKLANPNLWFDKKKEKAYKDWLDADSRHLIRMALGFGAVAYLLNHFADYTIAGANYDAILLARISVAGIFIAILGVMLLFREINPTSVVISVAIIASGANTIIAQFMPVGGVLWVSASQAIVALFMTVIVLRFRNLIIVATILFVVPTTLMAISRRHSGLEFMEGAFLATASSGMVFIGHFIDKGRRTIFRLSQNLQCAATHDALTNLPNRALLHERMDEELKRTRRGESFALLCLDLDGFKNINDTLGHAAGDQLLKEFAKRLDDCVRETDTIARMGGDEFAIMQISANPVDDATALAKRIYDVIDDPFELGQNEVVLGISIGITIAPKDGDDYEQLLKNADLALYRTKSENRGAYCFFEREMEMRAKDLHALALDLRKALASDQLELYYQPLVNLRDNRISGFEALMRWHHPERGMVSPAEFIPIAESTGLINQLGEFAVEQACREAVNWPDDIKVAVNVSPVQFRKGDLKDIVAAALASSGLSASRLELEVTESVLMQDEDVALTMLHQLHDLGVKISMDDFGTGYSSLSYLQSFPFDKIKIDATFVRDLSKGNDGIGVVHAVVGFASRLGVETTAEGVETEEQLNIIRKEGCTQAQGYLFARPMPASEISLAFLRQITKKMKKAA